MCTYVHKFLYIGITQHPSNDTFCVGSTVLLNCTVYDNTINNAAENTGWFREDKDNHPVLISSNMINNTRNGDVVTSVLTIDNVSLNDNRTEYFCVPSFSIGSYIGVILVAGTCTYVYMYVGMNICNFCTYMYNYVYQL